jgi:hypothetical protein
VNHNRAYRYGPLAPRSWVLNTRVVPLPLLRPMLATTGQPGLIRRLWFEGRIRQI